MQKINGDSKSPQAWHPKQHEQSNSTKNKTILEAVFKIKQWKL